MNRPAILVVDDNPDNLFLIQELISEYLPECQVLATLNPAEGLEIAKTHSLDVALIDVQMPVMDGVEMCRRLKSDPTTSYFPIVLMTAYQSTPALRAESLKTGADDFITRPIDNGELIAKIKVMLRIKKADDELRRMNAHLENLAAEKSEALRKSEEQLRLKLDSILLPETEIDRQEVINVLNIPSLQSLMDDFFKLTNMVTAILDLKGNILVAAGWQEICTHYHRRHPQTQQNCVESDLHLAQHVEMGTCIDYKCKNNLWDVVTPLMIAGKHVGNIYTGQFFYDDEIIDEESFIHQAEQYGFDRESYLAALRKVPRFSRDQVKTYMDFLVKFAALLANLGYSNLKLAKTLSEQKKDEIALRESETRYRSLFENMLEGFAYCRMLFEEGRSEDFIYLAVNNAYERLTGLKVVVGKRVTEIIPRIKELNPELFEIFGRVSLTGVPEKFEIYIKPIESWLSVSVYSPEKEYFITVFDNITERKLADYALRRSEERFRQIAEISGEWIWEIDRNGVYRYSNSTVERILGYSPGEVVNQKHYYDFFVPELREKQRESAMTLLARKEPFCHFVNHNVHKNGKIVILETNVAPLLDENGTFLGYRGTNTDITVRKQYEDERETTLHLLQLLHCNNDKRRLIEQLTDFLHHWSNCQAVGIRLRDGDDFPYYETRGFPPEFVLAENRLCAVDEKHETMRDSRGNPVLECMCGNVLCGRFDSRLPFFTAYGSFWSNCTTGLLAGATEADRQSRTRNRCNGEGYESVALIPLRFGECALGLLQFNDKRENRFTPESIAFLERAAANIATALQQRITQEILKDSEEKFRQLAESIHEVFWIVSPDWEKVLYISPAYESIWGRSRASLYERPESWLDAVLEEDWEPLLANLRKKASGDLDQMEFPEYRIRRPDGSIRWILTRAYPIRNERGVIYRIAGLAEDITDRKQAELALQESEERYQQLFNHMGDGVAVYQAVDEGRDFVILDINQPGQSLSKVVLSEVVGRRVTDVFPAVERIGLLDVFRRVWQTGRPEGHPLTLYKDTHIQEWVENYVYKIPSGLIVAIYSDTSARRKAEEALRISESLYHSLVEHLPLCIYRKDLEGHYTFASQTFCHYVGKSLPEVIGKTVFDLCSRAVTEKFMEDDRQVIETGMIHELVEENQNAQGEKTYVQAIKTPMRDAEGKIIGVQGIFWDITEQRRLEDQLRQAQKMEAIGQLAGGIAHDFNNILSAIYGYTHLALSNIQGVDEEACQFLEMSLEAADRAKNLVKQILAFSRKSEYAKSPLTIAPLVKEVLKMLRASLPSTIEINQNIFAASATVLADATQIHQVLMNLCTNAAHAMKETGGVLEINLTDEEVQSDSLSFDPTIQPGRYVCLKVSDTGHGIDPAIQDRIFDPFFSTKDKSEGTGLGLSVALGIVKSHNGSITFHSEPGQGTTFTIFLPQIETEIAEDSRESILQRGHGEHILLIDDEIPILRIGKRMLESLGYQVTTEQNGPEALATFRATPGRFDLVITDLTMPKMTGLQLTEELLQIRPDIPIILHTGNNEAISAEKAESAGIRGTILKPYSIQELSQLIQDVLVSR